MNRVGDDLLLQSLERQEDMIHTCADAIDAKAGMILAAAAFLAVQPAVLLIVPNISRYAFLAQIASYIVLCVGAFFAHAVLQIAEYTPPGFDEEWRDSIIDAAAPDATEEIVARTILWGLIEQTKGRLASGRVRNDEKLRTLAWARHLTSVAFCINGAIVVEVLISRFV
jgi:hypothetical protein